CEVFGITNVEYKLSVVMNPCENSDTLMFKFNGPPNCIDCVLVVLVLLVVSIGCVPLLVANPNIFHILFVEVLYVPDENSNINAVLPVIVNLLVVVEYDTFQVFAT